MNDDRATPVSAAIALGSNLGDRRTSIDAACARIARLPGTTLVAVAPTAEYEAMGFPGVPESIRGGPYLNSAVTIQTRLTARQLLEAILTVERSLGRVRPDASRWAARTIDLDLLLYSSAVVDEPGLCVPHPRMHERRFVLEPLAAIAGDWPVPGRKGPTLTVRELLARLPQAASTRGLS